ncbi:hypothetical protein AC140_12510 [Bacteroides fragilis]|nr:hypothetical protein AC140_12510 [Bacteroides fragilis]
MEYESKKGNYFIFFLLDHKVLIIRIKYCEFVQKEKEHSHH